MKRLPHSSNSPPIRIFLICLWAALALALGSHAQDEEESELEEAPIAQLNGVPYITITINDVVGDFDAWDAHTRERILREALKEAIDEAKLPYAYSLSFRPSPRQKWVPELNFEIIEWRFSNTDAIVCQIDAEYYDALEKRHDLKGAFGVENPLNISTNPHEIEDYMKKAATKAFLKIMKRIRQKGLYRTP